MKHQGLIFSKDKTKKINVSSAAILLGSLKVELYIKVYGYTAALFSPFQRKKRLV